MSGWLSASCILLLIVCQSYAQSSDSSPSAPQNALLTTLGTLKNELIAIGPGNRNTSTSAESSLANLYCNAMLEANNHTNDIVVCLINGGAFSQNLGPGPITYQTLVKTYARSDTVVRMMISGDTLMKALEHGVTAYPNDGWFPQVGNIKYSFLPLSNFNSPTGFYTSVVIAIIESNGLTYAVGGTEPNVELVTTSWLAAGNDGYSFLKDGKILSNSTSTVNDAVGAYMERNTPLELYPEGRVIDCIAQSGSNLCKKGLLTVQAGNESSSSASMAYISRFGTAGIALPIILSLLILRM